MSNEVGPISEAPLVELIPPSQPGGKSHGRAAFAFIFITVALDMVALGIIIPVLPRLIVQFEHGDMAKAATQAGIFAFIWAAMQFIFAPVMGSLSDRFGRRPVVLLSNFGLGCDYVLMALAPTLSWLFIGRVISGITAASIPTANAYIADVTPEEKRAAKFGMLGAAFGLGFIIGPAVGGFLGGYGLRYPFWASAILSFANALYGLFVLPESLPKERRSAFSVKRANPLGALKLLRSHPQLAGLAVATFLYNNAHESLPSMYVLYTDYRYHFTSAIDRIRIHRCRRRLDDRLRLPHLVRDQKAGRGTDAVHRLAMRVGGFRSARRRAHYGDLADLHSTVVVVGAGRSGDEFADDEERGQVAARAIAGRSDEYVWRRGNDRAARLHPGLQRRNFAQVGISSAWRAVLAGGVVDVGQPGDRG